MPKGGARSRSGPPKDPTSRTSERAGYVLTALPAEGYRGRVPGLLQFLPNATARHRQVWNELWRTPQACAWSLERWRWPVVADLTFRMVLGQDPDAPAAVATAVRQLRDDLGLSTAGLRMHGWAIATAPGPQEGSTATREGAPAVERRLRSVT